MLAYFVISAGTAVSLYFNYFYCGGLLKEMGFTPGEIIQQNFIISMFELAGMILTVYLSYWIYPLKILKFKALFYLPFLILFPFLLSNSPTPLIIFLMQALGVMIGLTGIPADAILFAHFPVFKRFTYVSFIYAISRSLMAVVTSFGLVFLTDFFGSWGLYFILIPFTISFLWGVYHYERLEHRTTRSFFWNLFQWRSGFNKSFTREIYRS